MRDDNVVDRRVGLSEAGEAEADNHVVCVSGVCAMSGVVGGEGGGPEWGEAGAWLVGNFWRMWRCAFGYGGWGRHTMPWYPATFVCNHEIKGSAGYQV